MSPNVALLLWVVLLFLLLRYDPGRESAISWAIWLPLCWFFFSQTRLPSQWLGKTTGSVATALNEGNAFDRPFLFGLIILAVFILVRRSFRWGQFLGQNFFLTAFLLFGLISFLWSDFASIALKRWIRDLGNYFAILVVLTDPNPLPAVRTFFRRLYFILIPLSYMMIKYYTFDAIRYDGWTGLPEYVGAATSKNTLGATCMLSGIFFFWDVLARWSERKETQTKLIILLNIVFFVMSFYVLRLSNSATSLACLLLGCGVILAYHFWRQHPVFIKTLIPVFLCSVILAYAFGLNEFVARSFGRDPSLTGRTQIWESLLMFDSNWLLGTGYESFWLGERLYQVWVATGFVTQAHNGYLEVYLNLGLVGLCILVFLLLSSYRRICKSFTHSAVLAPLVLASWTLALFYNITEAAFKAPFMCLTFLVGALIIPGQRQQEPQPLLRAKILPQVGRPRMVPKWAGVNRLRIQGKSDHG